MMAENITVLRSRAKCKEREPSFGNNLCSCIKLIIIRADGRKYSGEYLDDKKHGYGVFTWSDGRMYKGQWKNGKQDGIGIFIDEDQVERAGEWKEGSREKWID